MIKFTSSNFGIHVDRDMFPKDTDYVLMFFEKDDVLEFQETLLPHQIYLKRIQGEFERNNIDKIVCFPVKSETELEITKEQTKL